MGEVAQCLICHGCIEDRRLIAEIREDLNTVYKTLYQGNGTPSLVAQMSNLEHRITALENKLDTNFKTIDTEISLKFKNITDVVNEKFNYISYQISYEFEKRKIDSSGRWSFRTSTLTAIIAGFCSLLAIIITEYIKRM